MKLEIKDSQNYAATIIQVPKPHKLLNSDRLYGITVFGMTAVVNDAWQDKEGDLAVFFPAECQISDAFASHANLYRHSELNADPNEVGYLEDSRRVRALKLRGNVSNGLIIPLYVLEMFVGDSGCFNEGDTFDAVGGVEVCRKYRLKEPKVAVSREGKKLAKAFKRVDETMMPEHIETDQWLRNEQTVKDDEILIVTQKLHGTSGRFANTLVKRKLSWIEKLLIRLGVNIATTEYDTVAGSRKTIKDPNNPDQKHWYGEAGDVWSEYLKKIEHSIPAGYVIYGEIVGYINEAPIQKGHTYEQAEGTNMLYVYRVATVSPDGMMHDLSWDQVRQFCVERGIKHVPELWRGPKSYFDLTRFVERNFATDPYELLQAYPLHMVPDVPVALSPGGTGKDEGIAIRIDGPSPIPQLYKFKNPSHYEYETVQLDSGEEDIESAES